MMIDEFVSSKGTVVSSTKVCTSVSLAVSLLEFIVFLWFCFGCLAGSTDHRGTPEYPGRTVTLEPAEGEICVSSFYNPNAHTTSNVYLYENLIGFSIICFLFKCDWKFKR